MQHIRSFTGARALSSTSDLLAGLGGIIAPENRKIVRAFTRDAMITHDQATIDSAGAFLIGELERLDPKFHEPLVSISWERDIDVRTDIQIGDESSSYTTDTFGMVGTPNAGLGISWASSLSTTLARPQLDIQKIVTPLEAWAGEVQYTVMELASAQQLGRSIDEKQHMVLRLKYRMDLDQCAYIGDPTRGTTGLVNHSLVTPANVVNGAGGFPQWSTKSYDEIMEDVNSTLIAAWAATGWTIPPNKLLVAPNPFGLITKKLVGTSGNASVLKWIKENNILTAQTGQPLDILPCKWLDKNNINGPAGSAATYDRMVAYTQREDFVRFPMVPIQGVQPQPSGIYIRAPFWAKIGGVEVVYPETLAYRDGIG